jgi:hypothetical protein
VDFLLLPEHQPRRAIREAIQTRRRRFKCLLFYNTRGFLSQRFYKVIFIKCIKRNSSRRRRRRRSCHRSSSKR